MPEIHNDVYVAQVKRTVPTEPTTVTLYDRAYREIATYETEYSHPLNIGGACVCSIDLGEKKFWFCEGANGSFGAEGIGKATVTGRAKAKQVVITTEACQSEWMGKRGGRRRR